MAKYTQMLESLCNDEGLTLKNGNIVHYKTGWQVATKGHRTTSLAVAAATMLHYKGNCGVWYSNGYYYVDKCQRVNTKKEALRIGREHHQISIYGWAKGNLVYC